MNKDNYPSLTFPEIYLLEGGYKAFYQSHMVSSSFTVGLDWLQSPVTNFFSYNPFY